MKNLLYKLADEYVHFEINGKLINIPYSISKEGNKRAIGELSSAGVTGRFANFGGKGSPKQIKQLVLKAARNESFIIKDATEEELVKFMIDHGIGVDCSGFVYNILDQYLRNTKKISLDTIILRYPGIVGKIERFLLQKNRIRRTSASTLTSDLNTIKVLKVKDIKPGDMLRFTHSDWKGKHIGIIIEVNKQYIMYAMTSQYTKTQGARFGKILILDKDKGLESQKWLELTKTGENYGKDAFDPQRGDSVRRLKIL